MRRFPRFNPVALPDSLVAQHMARRKRGTPPSYRLHKATGQAIVTIDGRDHYLGEFNSADSTSRYAQLIAEHAMTGRNPEPDRSSADESAITVVELLAAFLEHAKIWYVKNGEPTNELDAFKNIMRTLRRLYGHLPVNQFGPLAFKVVRQEWISRGQSRPTVNKNAGRLKRIFKWGVSEELVPAGVYQALLAVDGLRKGRCECREPDPIGPVDLKVVELTLPLLPPVTADMVRFQLLTGARPGEVCTLTPQDVDRSNEVWEYRVSGHKTEHHGRSRTIYIGPDAQALLMPYLLRPSEAVCFSMAESLEQRRQLKSDRRKTPVSCGNRRGKRSMQDRCGEKQKRSAAYEFDSASYRKAIYHACDSAFPAPEPIGQADGESKADRLRRLSTDQREELKSWEREHRWHPNQLRHTRGTEVRKRFGLEAAQVILGHAAADVTQIYAERDAEKAREVVREIG